MLCTSRGCLYAYVCEYDLIGKAVRNIEKINQQAILCLLYYLTYPVVRKRTQSMGKHLIYRHYTFHLRPVFFLYSGRLHLRHQIAYKRLSWRTKVRIIRNERRAKSSPWQHFVTEFQLKTQYFQLKTNDPNTTYYPSAYGADIFHLFILS